MRPRARDMQLSSTRSSLEDPFVDSVLQQRISILSSSPPLGRIGFGLLRRACESAEERGLSMPVTPLGILPVGRCKQHEPRRTCQAMERETHAPHSTRPVRALPAGGGLEYFVRLRLVCIFHRNSQSDDPAQLYRRLG